jgi:hypothetical protein
MPDRIKEASRPLDFLNHRPAGPGHGGDDEQSMATQKSSPEEWRCARNANCNVSATWCVRDLHRRWIAEQGRYAIVPTLLHDTATICQLDHTEEIASFLTSRLDASSKVFGRLALLYTAINFIGVSKICGMRKMFLSRKNLNTSIC